MTGSSHAAGRTGLSPSSSLPATHFPFPNSPDGSERPRPADSFAPLRPSPDIFRKARLNPKNRSAPARTSLPESLCPDRSARKPPENRPKTARVPPRAGTFSRTVPNLSRSSRTCLKLPARTPPGQRKNGSEETENPSETARKGSAPPERRNYDRKLSRRREDGAVTFQFSPCDAFSFPEQPGRLRTPPACR